MIKLLIGLMICASAVADASAPKGGPNSEFLPGSFVAKFEQVYKSSLKGKKKSSAGVIEYKYPGNIRLEVKKPSDITFISNPKRTWYYRAPFIEGEPGELRVKRSKNMIVAKFFDSLKHGLKSNKLYKVKGNVLSFTKKTAKETGVKEATLHFQKSKEPVFGNISEIDLVFNDNKKVKLVFKKMHLDVKLHSNRFTFLVPKNTNVVQ